MYFGLDSEKNSKHKNVPVSYKTALNRCLFRNIHSQYFYVSCQLMLASGCYQLESCLALID